MSINIIVRCFGYIVLFILLCVAFYAFASAITAGIVDTLRNKKGSK